MKQFIDSEYVRSCLKIRQYNKQIANWRIWFVGWTFIKRVIHFRPNNYNLFCWIEKYKRRDFNFQSEAQRAYFNLVHALSIFLRPGHSEL